MLDACARVVLACMVNNTKYTIIRKEMFYDPRQEVIDRLLLIRKRNDNRQTDFNLVVH